MSDYELGDKRDAAKDGKCKQLSDEPFFTQTMARLLEKQGCYDDALVVYTILLKRFPDNKIFMDEIKRLEEKAQIFTRQR